MRFAHCISNAPVCSPFRSMLMSGQHPLYNGVFCNDVSILHNGPHLAEVLRDAGYRTGYVGKWHLYGGDRNRPIPAGADRLGFDDLFLSDNCSLQFGPKDSYYWNAQGEKTLYHEWQPYGQAKQAIDFLDAQSPDRPFALFMSVHPPHNFGKEHYKTEPELMAKYDPASVHLRPNVEDTPEMRDWYRGYMAMVTGVDEAFRPRAREAARKEARFQHYRGLHGRSRRPPLFSQSPLAQELSGIGILPRAVPVALARAPFRRPNDRPANGLAGSDADPALADGR